jgi:phosphoribosyl 1,2-cyclic phosphate phosphodiesterase
MPILGFRLGSFAYVTDVNSIPKDSLEKLRGVKYLALDGLRYRKHPTHFSLSEAASVAAEIGAEQTFLIHMCHDVDHEEGNSSLPDGVSLAYDGQVLEINESAGS